MVPPTPTPSARLLRAAAAERDELARHRARLLAARTDLRAEFARIESSLREVDEREVLLDRLAGGTGDPSSGPGDEAAHGDNGGRSVSGRDDASARAAAGVAVLRGPDIRRAAVEVLLAHPERPEAMHYRRWFELLREAGHEVAGKDPLAVFLTQVSRSPLVRKGTQAGVYELDPKAPVRLRAELDQLHEALRALTGSAGATADLAAIRERRAELTARIGQVEKALEEAESLLAGDLHGSRTSALAG